MDARVDFTMDVITSVLRMLPFLQFKYTLMPTATFFIEPQVIFSTETEGLAC